MSNTDLLSGESQTQADASGTAETSSSQSSGGSEDTGSRVGSTAPDASSSGGGSSADDAAKQPKRRAGGLSGMVIADLRELAVELGVDDTTGMRKGDLIAAIRERQGKSKRKSGGTQAEESSNTADPQAKSAGSQSQPSSTESATAGSGEQDASRSQRTAESGERRQQGGRDSGQQSAEGTAGQQNEDAARSGSRRRRGGANRGGNTDGNQRGGETSSEQGDGSGGSSRQNDRQQGDRQQGDRQQGDRQQGDRQQGDRQQNSRQQNDRQQGDRQQNGRQQNDRQQGDRQQNDRQQGDRQQNDRQGDEDRGSRRGRRHRDRRRRSGGRGDSGPDTEIREDDVLLPVAGILDVLDNYAFVRTSGYLAGSNDVYVSLSHVRKYGLRRGDAITGVVRQPREGEQQRQKFNPLVRVDSVNGLEPETSKKRSEFTKLTPLYPNERLRLETDPNKLTTRVVDLAMPVGKGQRALIVSPPKAGKTTILQEIANAITTNNPECHLMVVLVDERPEEVTDMQRSVNGEVIAATFDRPPSDHTTLAELAIERAKRLVELGHDVVVLLDSVTRLGRAYNLAAPASGRILSGGVDSTALYPPKRFLGAARNIEEGGSLTIFATALVETGSTGDSVIFEEFKGTGNAELKLDRKIAEKRTFPAVDVNASGTRKEELLLSPEELSVTHRLHRVLHALDQQQAIDLLLDRLRKSKTNIEFLTQVAKQAPGEGEE